MPARKGASAGALCAHSAGALARPPPPLLRAAAFVVCPFLLFHSSRRRPHDFFFPFHAFPFPFLPFSCRSFRPVSASVVPAEAMGANGMPLRLMAWMPALPRRNRPPVIPPSPATLAHPPAMPPTPRTRRPPGFRHPATPCLLYTSDAADD